LDLYLIRYLSQIQFLTDTRDIRMQNKVHRSTKTRILVSVLLQCSQTLTLIGTLHAAINVRVRAKV
jgi:hypothetical protein